MNLMFLWYKELLELTRELKPKNEKARGRLDELGRDSPEALIQSLIVSDWMDSATDLINANRLREARDALVKLADLAYIAADAPTLFVRSPLRYQTRFMGMGADVLILKLVPTEDRARILRLRDNLHRLVADGRSWKESRRQCIPFLLSYLTSSMTKELAADWKLETPEGAEAFRRRNWWLSQVGRALIQDWLDDEPDAKEAKKSLDDLKRWADRHKGPEPPTVVKPGPP